MKIQRSYTTKTNRQGMPEGVNFDVEIEIDLDEVARALAAQAIYAKGKKSTAMQGAIKCRVMPTEK